MNLYLLLTNLTIDRPPSFYNDICGFSYFNGTVTSECQEVPQQFYETQYQLLLQPVNQDEHDGLVRTEPDSICEPLQLTVESNSYYSMAFAVTQRKGVRQDYPIGRGSPLEKDVPVPRMYFLF